MTAEKREVVQDFVHAGISISRACYALSFSRSCYYRQPRDWRVADAVVIDAINAQLKKSPHAGFWKCFHRLRRKGHHLNHKRVYRVYCKMGLNLRRRTRRVISKRPAQPLDIIDLPNIQWALDFMHDSLYCGRRFRTLNILDEGTRECLGIEVDTSLPTSRVLRVMERLKEQRGLPKQLRVDNGPELISAEFCDWCRANGIGIVYTQPGRPQQNAFVERFNGSFRRECPLPLN